MSYTEINDHYGMHFGGINEDEIIRRLETTDQKLIDDVKGNDDFHTTQAEYTDYARGEIVDWGPDNVFLESDRPARDPALSRSIVNLHYGGTRGSNPNLPMHPELFIGFTGNDPRGANTDPRFDNMRGWATTQAVSLSARFQESNDSFIADRPWTGPAKSYAMKDLHQRVAGNTKVFTTEKVNWATGRNTTMDDVFGLRDRRFAIEDGTDGMFIPEQNQPRTFSAAISEAFTNGGAKAAPMNMKSLKNQWNSVNDSDLEINVYRPSDPSKTAALKQAKHQNTMIAHDADLSTETISQEGKKQMMMGLATLMSMATKRHTSEDADHVDSNLSADLKHKILYNTSGHAVRAINEDQDRQPTILEDDSPGLYKTPTPHKDIVKAGFNQVGSQNHNALMGDIQTMIKKMGTLGCDTSLAQNKVGQQVMWGANQKSGDRGKSISKPSDTVRANLTGQNNEVHTAAAAKGLEINIYKTSTLPKHKLPDVTTMHLFNDALRGRVEGKSKAPEFLSHDPDNNVTDNPSGIQGQQSGGYGPVAHKKLRAREHGDANLGENVEDSAQGV